MNNVLALQMISEDVGGTVEPVDEGKCGTEEALCDASNEWGHGHGGHGHGRSHISLLLCR